MDKFIFVHILKCAGTTLKYSIFDKYLKDKYLYDSKFKPRHNKLIRDSEHPVIIEPQSYPSNYINYNIIFGHFKYDKYEHLNLPMFSFVRHPVDRMISQYYYHKSFYEKKGLNLSLIEFSEIWKNHMSYVLGDINKYTYIGNVENMDKSIKTFCKIIGINSPNTFVKKRSRQNKQRIDKKTRMAIKDMNAIDMKLYENIINKWS